MQRWLGIPSHDRLRSDEIELIGLLKARDSITGESLVVFRGVRVGVVRVRRTVVGIGRQVRWLRGDRVEV